jgi:hypothetical protein
MKLDLGRCGRTGDHRWTPETPHRRRPAIQLSACPQARDGLCSAIMIRWFTKRLGRRSGDSKSAPAPIGRRSAPENKARPWHAVSLVAGATCCDGVRSSRGRRWFPREAPRLPLFGCDVEKCECLYRHHPDRRSRARRDSDWIGTYRPYNGPERRAGPRSRREADSESVESVRL